MTDLLLLLHLGATLAMVGLIWVVQIAVYPLLARLGDGFHDVHAAWCRAITWVVAPLFALEGLGAAALVLGVWPAADPPAAWIGLAAFLGAGASTAFVQVPLHARLGRGFDAVVHARLVRTNWLRTGLWTVHGGVVLWLIAAGVGAG